MDLIFCIVTMWIGERNSKPKVTQYEKEVAPSAPKGEAKNLIKKPMNPANSTMNPANLSSFF